MKKGNSKVLQFPMKPVGAADIEDAICVVDSALHGNSGCETGLLVNKRIFATPAGPSGGPELLCTIYMGGPTLHYWYGHVRNHPEKACFVSLIAWSKTLINASSQEALFTQYQYWIEGMGDWEPCSAQDMDDAYMEAKTFAEAAENMAEIISRFEISRRCGFKNTPYEKSPIEMRLMDVYIQTLQRDTGGCFPAPPPG